MNIHPIPHRQWPLPLDKLWKVAQVVSTETGESRYLVLQSSAKTPIQSFRTKEWAFECARQLNNLGRAGQVFQEGLVAATNFDEMFPTGASNFNLVQTFRFQGMEVSFSCPEGTLPWYTRLFMKAMFPDNVVIYKPVKAQVKAWALRVWDRIMWGTRGKLHETKV